MCDFFVAVTATFRMLCVLVVIEHGTRRLAHVNVTPHPNADWLRRSCGPTCARPLGWGMRVGLDPTLPEALTAFDIHSNPADRLPSLAQFSKALDRALTLPELHAFWRRVDAAADSPARDALIACMYLGGQRPTQLLRVTPQLVDLSGATLTLLDPKGRNLTLPLESVSHNRAHAMAWRG